MKNPDKVTPITRSPYFTSLGSNPIIFAIAKPKMWITRVIGGGCPFKLTLVKFCNYNVVHPDSNNS
jgi:hypothetical protein